MTTTTGVVDNPVVAPSTSDVAKELSRALGGRWHQTREKIRNMPQAGFDSPAEELPMEEYRKLTDKRLRAVAKSGMAASGYPRDFGGTGDFGAAVTGFEMLGHQDLSLMVKAGVHFGLFGGAVSNLGTERHRTYMAGVLDASVPGCFAMTETGHGSDVNSLETTATYDPATDELIVHSPTPSSRKDYIGGAARSARIAAVFAQLIVPAPEGSAEDPHRGVHCVLVPLRDEQGNALPGITIGDCGPKAGLLGVDNGRIMFDSVRVPRENLLGRYGDIDDQGRYSSPIESPSRRFFTMLGTLVRGRVSVAGGAGAATRTALAITVRYANGRRQFSDPVKGGEVALLDYLAHQRKLLPAIAGAYALAYAQNDLVLDLNEVQAGRRSDEESQRELETLAAGLKAYATSFATSTIQTCREACGGAGYLNANRLPRLKADTDVFTTFEGDNTVLLQLVAKALLTGFRRSFGSLDTVAMVRFGSKLVAEQVVERTSVRGVLQRLRGGTDHALTSREEQERLLADRETHLLESLARRLRKAKGGDAFTVFNAAQDHLLETATAHVERIVFESFADGLQGCVDNEAKALLAKLCDLYALSTIEKHKAWYLEHDRLSPERAKAVTRLVNQLCAELRPHAQTLVDGFGIPQAWLTTEMTTGMEPQA